MRCTNWSRVGALGTLGVGLFIGVGAQANPGARVPSPAIAAQQVSLEADVVPTPRSVDFLLDRPGESAQKPPQITPWQSITVDSGDSLSRIFKHAGLVAKQWAPLLDLGDTVDPLRQLQPGDTLTIRKTPDNRLAALRFPIDAVDTLSITRRGEQLHADIVQLHSQTRRLSARGTVDGSLAQALAEAGVPAEVSAQMADIYRYRANLSRHMHPGDQFSVIYDAEFADGERVAAGPVIAASITTGDSTLNAFRARDARGRPHYYDSDGQPYEPAISRYPLHYTHVSSSFNPGRVHPILRIRRPHNGVDLAAPRGTPIKAAADGKITFTGRKRGYGRLIELEHFDGYATSYSHMSRLASDLKKDQRVSRGQIIGYVGATGVATAPHLHFEIHKDGIPHNPMTMKLPDGVALADKRLALFSSRIQPLIARLEGAPNMNRTLIAASTGTPGESGSCARAGTVNAALALAPASASKHHSLDDLFCLVTVRSDA